MARLQRTSERAFVLPIAGLLLFTPPLLTLFGGTATVAGVPLILLYLLGAWLGLIYAGRHLSARLLSSARTRSPQNSRSDIARDHRGAP